MEGEILISRNGQPFSEIRSLLLSAQYSVTIFAPYINSTVLSSLLRDIEVDVSVITTWKVRDLWMGYSDLKLFKLSEAMGFRVYLNNNIHLKVYLADWVRCVYGSANLTMAGLGISEKPNHELCGSVSQIDTETHLYLRQILGEASLLDKSLYESFNNAVSELPDKPAVEEVDIDGSAPGKAFLISSLPMSNSIDSLYEIYVNFSETVDIEEKNCAMHDIALYSLPIGLTRIEFEENLRAAFFSSPFIIEFSKYLNKEGRYFGAVKAWIQGACTDVPLPSRRDLTGNIQVLYKWMVYLGEGKYETDRPNHSERITKIF